MVTEWDGGQLMAIANILLSLGGKQSQVFTVTGVHDLGIWFYEAAAYPLGSGVQKGTCVPSTHYGRQILRVVQNADGATFCFAGDARDWWAFGRVYSLTHGTSVSVAEMSVFYSDVANITYFLGGGLLFPNYATTTTQTFYIETK